MLPRRRALLMVAILMAIVAVAVASSCYVSPYLSKRRLMSSISSADRVVIRTNYSADGVPVNAQVTYEDAGQIASLLAAIEAAPRDNTDYDTPVGMYLIEFYRGNVLIGTAGTCSSLVRCQGNQYRDRSRRIESVVDAALQAKLDSGK